MNIVKRLQSETQRIWEASPKEAKVFIYILVSALLNQFLKDFRVDFLYFIPEVYRIAVYNLIVVFIVEMAKRIQEYRARCEK